MESTKANSLSEANRHLEEKIVAQKNEIDRLKRKLSKYEQAEVVDKPVQSHRGGVQYTPVKLAWILQTFGVEGNGGGLSTIFGSFYLMRGFLVS